MVPAERSRAQPRQFSEGCSSSQATVSDPSVPCPETRSCKVVRTRHCFNLVDIDCGPSWASYGPAGDFRCRFRPCREPSDPTRWRTTDSVFSPHVRRDRGLKRPNQPSSWLVAAGMFGFRWLRTRSCQRATRWHSSLHTSGFQAHPSLGHHLPQPAAGPDQLPPVVPRPTAAGQAAEPGPGGSGHPRQDPGCADPTVRCLRTAHGCRSGPDASRSGP